LHDSDDSSDFHLLEGILDAQDVVELAATLLRYCRRKERDYLQQFHEFGTLQEALSETYFEDLCQPSLGPTSGALKQALVQAIQASRYPVITARAMALALDQNAAPLFQMAFRNRPQPIVLQPEEPVPVNRPPLAHLLGKPLTARPESQDDRLDFLPHLRLAPSSLAGCTVELDFRLRHYLSPLFDLARATEHCVATAAPNADMEDFTIQEVLSTPRPSFFGVVPKNPGDQTQVLLASLAVARQQQATILILPELCLTESSVEALQRALEQERSQFPRMVVAGSFHGEFGGTRFNRCRLLLRRPVSGLTHDKFNPYNHAFAERDNITRIEDIGPIDRKIRLYYTGNWTFTTLICKDFLGVRVPNLLSELGVNLALIPAFSAKLDTFQSNGCWLANQAQALVAVANTPAATGGPRATFCLPRAGRSMVNVPNLENSVGTTPGLVLFQPRTGAVRWCEVPIDKKK
jgi:predicted amidohydrolase